jgi:phenylalanyl-tRNA synthetase beta chain
MRVPVSWLAEYVDLPADLSARALGEALIGAGLEVETVEEVGTDLTGPLVVGRVLAFADEPQSNGKTIRWCTVEVGEAEPRGIVCGAHNFAVGDHVVVALPGAVLPGGFAIASRKTYGHVSDGMICSVRELGLGEDHDGILVLTDADRGEAIPGDDARALLGIPDAVLDIAVTPDRGYCLSIRGVAREAATALGVAFRDPADRDLPVAEGLSWPVSVADSDGCDRFVTRTVSGLDPHAASPLWLRTRLHLAGMRPLSLAVDVTNYVMLELGQPIHGYDADRLAGGLGVRRAAAGERLRTLDDAERALDPADLLIVDDSGPIGIAGVMGGASTEIHDGTTRVVVEAAHFDPVSIARTARRHKLPSEASRRFERGVDAALPPAAADRVVELLVSLGGATAESGMTDVDSRRPIPAIVMDPQYPTALAGMAYSDAEVVERLTSVGCHLAAAADRLSVTPPSWRPDLTQPADLVEEVARLHGYANLPSVLPRIRPGSTAVAGVARHLNRALRALAAAGAVEVRNYPFIGTEALDALGLPADDERRRMLRLANPLSDAEPYLRTTMLPGLLAAARRNVGRGNRDLWLFEIGRVYRPRPDAPIRAPRPGVDGPPSDAELAALDAALPDQPRHLAVVLTGAIEQAGWWGAGRDATWADAIESARIAAAAIDAPLEIRAGVAAPWHPGRCAELVLDGAVIGHAGELHPKVCEAVGLPPRTCAAELDLGRLASYAEPLDSAPAVSTFPPATVDVALVVPQEVPAAVVADTMREGAGPLLESVRLFDLYAGEQVPAGTRSLAFSLTFRAADRTLTTEEATAARDAAVALAAERCGALLRA